MTNERTSNLDAWREGYEAGYAAAKAERPPVEPNSQAIDTTHHSALKSESRPGVSQSGHYRHAEEAQIYLWSDEYQRDINARDLEEIDRLKAEIKELKRGAVEPTVCGMTSEQQSREHAHREMYEALSGQSLKEDRCCLCGGAWRAPNNCMNAFHRWAGASENRERMTLPKLNLDRLTVKDYSTVNGLYMEIDASTRDSYPESCLLHQDEVKKLHAYLTQWLSSRTSDAR